LKELWCFKETQLLLLANVMTMLERNDFFVFWLFFKKIKNESVRNLFSSSAPFESCQSDWCDS
jgi:hypothetical protein